MAEPDLTENVRKLETLIAQLREANVFLFDNDTWDRWGRPHASDQEIDERMARERVMIDQRARCLAELQALVAALRTTAPASVAAWADAHDELLAAFIAENEKTPNGHTLTAIDVAKQERVGWQAVKRGEQALVDSNHYFITIDREHYKRLFGIDP